MNRFDLVSVSGLLVLMAGLASCSRDQEKVRDSYKAPPPVIVTGKGNQGFLQWERESDKTLDLQDAFDISAGNPARTEVHARCMRDKASFSAKFIVNGRRPVKILQVVPQDILFDDLAKSAVTCDWEVTLSNESGSRHILRLPTSPLSDRGNPEVTVENSANNERIKLLQIMKTEGIKIRYRNSEPASAEIICRDVTFEPLPFEKVIELSRFDLRKPVYRPSRSEMHVLENPLQPCRIALSESGQLKALSSLMMIHVPRKPFEYQIKNLISTFPIPNVIERRMGGIPYAEVFIRNPANIERTIQIPRVLNWQVHFLLATRLGTHMGFALDTAHPKRTTIAVPWMSVEMVGAVQVIKEEPAGWTVVLPGRGVLTLSLHYKEGYGGCLTKLAPVAFAFPTQTLVIPELMPTGDTIPPIQITLPEFWWQMNAVQFQNTPQLETRCL